MAQGHAIVPNKLGLHARAAAKLVERANGFDSHVAITNRDKTVNGKSIMGVLMLAASMGTELTVETTGEDADQALQAVLKLINDGFGELQ